MLKGSITSDIYLYGSFVPSVALDGSVIPLRALRGSVEAFTPGEQIPSLDFSDADNSEYLVLI